MCRRFILELGLMLDVVFKKMINQDNIYKEQLIECISFGKYFVEKELKELKGINLINKQFQGNMIVFLNF